MKVFLVFYGLFFMCMANVASAQVSPYIDSQVYYEEEPYGVRVLPIVKTTAEPRGYHFDMRQDEDMPEDTGSYLDEIRSRGKLLCGTNLQLKSYAAYKDGEWSGIDADMCKALAIAILGDADKIEMVNVDAKDVYKALRKGRIDVMLSGATFSAHNEMEGQADVAGVLYYDQQMIMSVDDSIDSLEKFNGKKICLATESDYYRNFEVYAVKRGLQLDELTFPDMSRVKEAFLLKRCPLVTGGALFLNGIKQTMFRSTSIVFPDQLAMSPVYALVEYGNDEMKMAVKWSLNALLLAEQYGITSANLKFFSGHNNKEIRNLLGDAPELWQAIGLRPRWVNDAIALLGNYGEIYERNLGSESAYKIKRRQGKLVKDGGVMYPLPFM